MKKLISVMLIALFLLSGLSVSAISQDESELGCKKLPENVQGPEEYCGQPLKNFNDIGK